MMKNSVESFFVLAPMNRQNFKRMFSIIATKREGETIGFNKSSAS